MAATDSRAVMSSQDSHEHESIQALMTHAASGESAEDVIRRMARDIVAKHRHFWKGPPFCPYELADLEGVIVEEAPCDIKSDGRIFPKGQQVYIQYRPGQSDERTRFTIFHELAHTLFPDCYKRERRRSPAEKAERDFENLCNLAASEFLFPLDEFSTDLGSQPIHANSVLTLAARYRASVDATAWRIVHLSSVPTCAAFVNYSPPKPKSVTSLSVKYSVANSLFKYDVHPNLRINSKSIGNKVYSEKKPQGSQESWFLSGQMRWLRVEAIPLPKFESKETSDLVLIITHT